MASGAPVVVSNLEVHREICGDAALYFDTFSEKDLAEKCVAVLSNHDLRAELIERGLERSKRFSWDAHVDRLIELIERCSALSPHKDG
jgi:glycosyltransferase involved in cell wall biosynthesis